MLDFNQWFMRSHFCTRQITNFSDKLEYVSMLHCDGSCIYQYQNSSNEASEINWRKHEFFVLVD